MRVSGREHQADRAFLEHALSMNEAADIPDTLISEKFRYYTFRLRRAQLAARKTKDRETEEFYNWQADHYRALEMECAVKLEMYRNEIIQQYQEGLSRTVEQFNRNSL